MQHNKAVLTTEQQIELLKERGLTITDEESAKIFLNKVSYFKFSAYLREFENNTLTHTYPEGTTFDSPVTLCIFDSKLRSILFDALEEIELAVKTKLIDKVTAAYGNNWYHDATLFNNTPDFVFDTYWEGLKAKLDKLKIQEKFINHYYNKYTIPEHPPIWMVMENLTLGTVSKMYEAFNNRTLREDIAWDAIRMVDKVFTTWLQHFTYLRNLCAHHCRVWNRVMTVRAKFPTVKKYSIIEEVDSLTEERNSRYAKVYASLCIINYFVTRINSASRFKYHVVQLMNEHPQINPERMGFTPNWRNEKMWIVRSTT